MTSTNTYPSRLTRIDELTLPEHHYLTSEEECVYWVEYTAKQNHAFSCGNQLILNLKKPPSRKNNPEWWYKEKAIQTVASSFAKVLKGFVLAKHPVFVPIPPSKARSDPEYDSRLTDILECMAEEAVKLDPACRVDHREILVQPTSTTPEHKQENGNRASPDDIYDRYLIDISKTQTGSVDIIILFDDVITTGAHYMGAKRKLQEYFPKAKIFGLFVARRKPNTTDFDDIGW